MASLQRNVPILSKAVGLLAVAGCLLAQDGNWSYHGAADSLGETRNDEVWTSAVVPSSPVYQLGVTCDDTVYVSVLVRSDAVITSAARLSVRFDDGASVVLPVQYSLATSKSFDFEPAGAALTRILASRKMAFSLQNNDQETPVQFDIAGLEAAIKQMPLKCQQRLAELLVAEKSAPKPVAHSRKTS
jgi:hypothetical protein